MNRRDIVCEDGSLDIAGSASCPVLDFGTSGAERSDPATGLH